MDTSKSDLEAYDNAARNLPDAFTWRMAEPLKGTARAEIVELSSGKSINISVHHLQPVSLALMAFAGPESVPTSANWEDELPETYEKDSVVLSKGVSTVDQRRSTVILEDGEPGRQVPSYSVRIDGKDRGHVLVLGEKKYVLLAPDLADEPSVHTGLGPAVQRIEAILSYAETRPKG